MTITRNFKLCLNAGTQNAPYINANQYDEGEQWIFDLYTEGGQKFTPSTGAIIGIKSDGHAILNSGTVNSDGQVVITETQQMTAASGLAVFELLIEGETHGTANFIVNVERRPSDDAEFSDSDLSMLQEAIDAAEVINEILDEGGDPSEVIGEHVDAWLDAHPEATTTVQDGAITAPKINQSLWDKLLVSEEASGNPASFDDGADDVPVSSLKVALEPVQLGSGDPSPTNVRPIIASNGKNLANVPNATKTNDAVTAVAVDGAVTANGTPNATGYIVIGTAHLTGGVEYAITGCPSGGGSGKYGIRIRDTSADLATDYGSGATYTPTGDMDVNVCIRYWYNFALNNVEFKPMIRLSSITDSTFQPYQGIIMNVVGKNLLELSMNDGTTAGVAYTRNADDSITCVGTPTSTSSTRTIYQSGKRLPNGTYILTGSASVMKVRVNLSSPDGTIIARITDNGNGATFTIDDTVGSMAVLCYASTLTEVSETIYPMIRYASVTDGTFEPHTERTYPMSLGQSVYGGTVDLATGVLAVDRVGVSLNDPTKWVNSTYTTLDFDYMVIFPDRKKTDDSYVGLICSYVPANNMQANYCRWYSASGNKFGIKTDGTLTLEQIKSDASAGNIFISYPLATPTTVQLTPTEVKTLLGYNNISSTGTVDVIYHADTKLYIDKKIGELS